MQLSLVNYIKSNKTKIILSGTKRFTDKSGEYYLKNVLIEKKNQNKIFKKLSLTQPTNIIECIKKLKGIQSLAAKADKIITKLPENSLTPIPTMSKKKIKNRFENKELSNAERTAVFIRRVEYSTEIYRNNQYKDTYDINKMRKIIFIQEWWKIMYYINKMKRESIYEKTKHGKGGRNVFNKKNSNKWRNSFSYSRNKKRMVNNYAPIKNKSWDGDSINNIVPLVKDLIKNKQDNDLFRKYFNKWKNNNEKECMNVIRTLHPKVNREKKLKRIIGKNMLKNYFNKWKRNLVRSIRTSKVYENQLDKILAEHSNVTLSIKSPEIMDNNEIEKKIQLSLLVPIRERMILNNYFNQWKKVSNNRISNIPLMSSINFARFTFADKSSFVKRALNEDITQLIHAINYVYLPYPYNKIRFYTRERKSINQLRGGMRVFSNQMSNHISSSYKEEKKDNSMEESIKLKGQKNKSGIYENTLGKSNKESLRQTKKKEEEMIEEPIIMPDNKNKEHDDYTTKVIKHEDLVDKERKISKAKIMLRLRKRKEGDKLRRYFQRWIELNEKEREMLLNILFLKSITSKQDMKKEEYLNKAIHKRLNQWRDYNRKINNIKKGEKILKNCLSKRYGKQLLDYLNYIYDNQMKSKLSELFNSYLVSPRMHNEMIYKAEQDLISSMIKPSIPAQEEEIRKLIETNDIQKLIDSIKKVYTKEAYDKLKQLNKGLNKAKFNRLKPVLINAMRNIRTNDLGKLTYFFNRWKLQSQKLKEILLKAILLKNLCSKQNAKLNGFIKNTLHKRLLHWRIRSIPQDFLQKLKGIREGLDQLHKSLIKAYLKDIISLINKAGLSKARSTILYRLIQYLQMKKAFNLWKNRMNDTKEMKDTMRNMFNRYLMSNEIHNKILNQHKEDLINIMKSYLQLKKDKAEIIGKFVKGIVNINNQMNMLKRNAIIRKKLLAIDETIKDKLNIMFYKWLRNVKIVGANDNAILIQKFLQKCFNNLKKKRDGLSYGVSLVDLYVKREALNKIKINNNEKELKRLLKSSVMRKDKRNKNELASSFNKWKSIIGDIKKEEAVIKIENNYRKLKSKRKVRGLKREHRLKAIIDKLNNRMNDSLRKAFIKWKNSTNDDEKIKEVELIHNNKPLEREEVMTVKQGVLSLTNNKIIGSEEEKPNNICNQILIDKKNNTTEELNVKNEEPLEKEEEKPEQHITTRNIIEDIDNNIQNKGTSDNNKIEEENKVNDNNKVEENMVDKTKLEENKVGDIIIKNHHKINNNTIEDNKGKDNNVQDNNKVNDNIIQDNKDNDNKAEDNIVEVNNQVQDNNIEENRVGGNKIVQNKVGVNIIKDNMITDNIQIKNKEVKEGGGSEGCNLITWKSTILNLQSQNRNINKKNSEDKPEDNTINNCTIKKEEDSTNNNDKDIINNNNQIESKPIINDNQLNEPQMDNTKEKEQPIQNKNKNNKYILNEPIDNKLVNHNNTNPIKNEKLMKVLNMIETKKHDNDLQENFDLWKRLSMNTKKQRLLNNLISLKEKNNLKEYYKRWKEYKLILNPITTITYHKSFPKGHFNKSFTQKKSVQPNKIESLIKVINKIYTKRPFENIKGYNKEQIIPIENTPITKTMKLRSATEDKKEEDNIPILVKTDNIKKEEDPPLTETNDNKKNSDNSNSKEDEHTSINNSNLENEKDNTVNSNTNNQKEVQNKENLFKRKGAILLLINKKENNALKIYFDRWKQNNKDEKLLSLLRGILSNKEQKENNANNNNLRRNISLWNNKAQEDKQSIKNAFDKLDTLFNNKVFQYAKEALNKLKNRTHLYNILSNILNKKEQKEKELTKRHSLSQWKDTLYNSHNNNALNDLLNKYLISEPIHTKVISEPIQDIISILKNYKPNKEQNKVTNEASSENLIEGETLNNQKTEEQLISNPSNEEQTIIPLKSNNKTLKHKRATLLSKILQSKDNHILGKYFNIWKSLLIPIRDKRTSLNNIVTNLNETNDDFIISEDDDFTQSNQSPRPINNLTSLLNIRAHNYIYQSFTHWKSITLTLNALSNVPKLTYHKSFPKGHFSKSSSKCITQENLDQLICTIKVIYIKPSFETLRYYKPRRIVFKQSNIRNDLQKSINEDKDDDKPQAEIRNEKVKEIEPEPVEKVRKAPKQPSISYLRSKHNKTKEMNKIEETEDPILEDEPISETFEQSKSKSLPSFINKDNYIQSQLITSNNDLIEKKITIPFKSTQNNPLHLSNKSITSLINDSKSPNEQKSTNNETQSPPSIPLLKLPSDRSNKRYTHYLNNKLSYTPQSNNQSLYSSFSKSQSLINNNNIDDDDSNDVSMLSNCSTGGTTLVQQQNTTLFPIDYTSQSFFLQSATPEEKSEISTHRPMRVKGDFIDLLNEHPKKLFGKNHRIQVINASCPADSILSSKEIADIQINKEKEKKVLDSIKDMCDRDTKLKSKYLYNRKLINQYALSNVKKAKEDNYSVVFPLKKNFVSCDFGKDMTIETDPKDYTKKVVLYQNGIPDPAITCKSARGGLYSSLSQKDLSDLTSSYNSNIQLKEINTSQFYKTPRKKVHFEIGESIKKPIVYESIKRSTIRKKTNYK